MTVASKTGGALLVGALILGVGSWVSQQPPKADGAGDRWEPVMIVAIWENPRDMQMTWTANGIRSSPEVDRISPWEKEIAVRPGGVVTFTVKPLMGGGGAHHCMIEHPPGIPMQGDGQKTGYGTTPITCTAVIGS
jgi:hypothetical protein